MGAEALAGRPKTNDLHEGLASQASLQSSAVVTEGALRGVWLPEADGETLQLSRAMRGLARAEEAMAARMTMFWTENILILGLVLKVVRVNVLIALNERED